MATLKKKSGTITFVKVMKNNVYEYTLTDKKNQSSKYISYCRRSISHNVVFEYEQKRHSVYGEQNQLKTVEYQSVIKDKKIIAEILLRIVNLQQHVVHTLIKTYGANFFELLLKDSHTIFGICDTYTTTKLKDFLQGEQPIVIMLFFSSIDPDIKISLPTCNKIIERFQCDTNKIKENVYDLYLKCKMKFEDVDKLALKYFGYTHDSTERLEAVLKLLTKILNKEGTIYTDINFMKKFCDKYYIIPKTLTQNITYIKIQKEKYFTTCDLYDMEQYVETFCKELIKMDPIPISDKIKLDERLHHRQEEAVKTALLNRVSIISGGPGTGKTHIIKEVMRNTQDQDHVILALSGAAVERIKQDGIDIARTIHSYLFSLIDSKEDSTPKLDSFDAAFESGDSSDYSNDKSNSKSNKIINIIIDEFSLVCMKLFKKLLVAMESNMNNIRLILIGDPNQLSSIGSGNVLDDMITSEIIPYTSLTKIHRTNIKPIIKNAKLVLEGQPLEPDNDKFIYKKITSTDQVYDILKDLISEYKLTPYNSCVLSPAATNNITVTKLNTFLQDVYNPDGLMICTNIKSEIRFGDKLMQTVNNKEDHIYNGSILSIGGYTYDEYATKRDISYKRSIANGKIMSNNKIDYAITPKRFNINIKCKYTDPDSGSSRIINYDDIKKINNLQLAYSMTIHKSQGSGYETVIAVIHSGMGNRLLYRNMLYTAITRSIKRCIIIADSSGLRMCRELGADRITNLFKNYKRGGSTS